MKPPYTLKIDAYSHIVPPQYKETLSKVAPKLHDRDVTPCRPLYDLDARFRIMDLYEPIRQVLTLGRIPVEHAAQPDGIGFQPEPGKASGRAAAADDVEGRRLPGVAFSVHGLAGHRCA